MESMEQERKRRMMYDWHTIVRDLTLRLVRRASVTNTPGETAFGSFLGELLRAAPYFREHPADVRVERTADDLHERSNVFALARGTGRETVLLAGHYDVVGVENYGALAPWAFDPEALRPRLIAALRAEGPSPADARALADLESGAFLPGRGALDMKCGLALGIALLWRWVEGAARRGNLLLIATPDEEENSHGMRAAVERLPALLAEWGLEAVAAINLDVTDDGGDDGAGQAIFLGSVGKLLPSVYIAGRDTHAGAPFAGVNPNFLAAAITQRVECGTALMDVAGGAAAPPPVCLQQIDLKERYSAATPAAAWCCYNLLAHARPPAAALELFMGVVREALTDALRQLDERARAYAALAGGPSGFPTYEPLVLSFADFKARALAQGGAPARAALDELTTSLAADPAVDLPRFSRRVIEALWPWSGLAGPAAVVCFASLYYPPARLDASNPRHARLHAAAARAAGDLSRELPRPIRPRPFFPGISDMSFLGGAEAPEQIAAVAANTPAAGARIRFDYAAIPGLPVINVGPWGRDYHQRTERVNTHYAFAVAPELVWRIVEEVLEPNE